MLYDVLLIDDDFSGENRINPYPVATELLYSLLRINCRVTFTTGELDDLFGLKKHDLSLIKFIFLDLDFTPPGIPSQVNKIDVSKIIGIMDYIAKNTITKEIVVHINSHISDEDERKNLKNELKKMFKEKFMVREETKEKNFLTDDMERELKCASLNVYTRNHIIIEHIDVDNLLKEIMEKLGSDLDEYETTFSIRLEKIREKLNSKKGKALYKQMDLLNKIRNQLAHNEYPTMEHIEIKGIKKDLMDCFCNDVCKGKCGRNNCINRKDAIKFQDFDMLVNYLNSVELLKERLDEWHKTQVINKSFSSDKRLKVSKK